MNGIDYSNIQQKMEISPRYGLELQEGNFKRLKAIMDGLLSNSQTIVIITGCDITTDSTNFSITEGAVYYQGLVYTVDAFTTTIPTGFTPIWVIEKEYTRAAWYGDGQQRDTFYLDKMAITMGASGSGVADYNEVETLPALLQQTLQIQQLIDNSLVNKFDTVVFDVGAWDMSEGAQKYIEFDIDFLKIRSFDVTILNDSGLGAYNLSRGGYWTYSILDNNYNRIFALLVQNEDSYFKQESWSDESVNRGYITITMLP